MTRAQAIALAATIAAGAAVEEFVRTGLVYDAVGDTCTVSTARGPCEAARALGADPDDCRPGSVVYRRVEQRFSEDAGTESKPLPPGFAAVTGSTVEVPCVSLRRPSKALTARKPNDSACVVGEWGRSDGGRGLGRCCEPGCSCAGRCVGAVPMVIAGADPTDAELCEAVPETCSDGGP